MEELRSTEILDKEILEDTRKKAERILANSENECKKILSDVHNRVEKIRAEKKVFYDDKVASFAKDKEAALPLEKQRYRVSFEQKAISSAIDDFLAKLPKAEKIRLIGTLLERYAPVLSGKNIRIQVSGFALADMQKAAQQALKNSKILECTEMSADTVNILAASSGRTDGMLIETEDKSIKCRAVIGEVTNELCDTYSYELAEALFGGRLPE